MKMDIFKMSKIRKPKIVLKKTHQKCPCDENAHKMGFGGIQCVTIFFVDFYQKKNQVFLISKYGNSGTEKTWKKLTKPRL